MKPDVAVAVSGGGSGTGIAAMINGTVDIANASRRMKDKEIKRDVNEVLKIVGLFDRANSFPEEFSEGEKQRLAIGRAMIHQPKIILADEPTGNLDPYYTRDIIKLLHNIYETGTTVILATHDKEVVNSLGQRVITLEHGKLIRDEQRGKYIL